MPRSSFRRIFRRPAFAAIAGFSAVLLSATLAEAGVIYVHPSAVSDPPDGLTWATAFHTVQAGIDAAAEGDEVWVVATTYVGQVRLKPGVALYGGFAGIETQLDQRDWTNNITILDGKRTNSVVVVEPGATNTTRIDGFTIQNGVTTRNGGGIVCSNASPVIANNVICTNRATLGGGIYGLNSFAVIQNNTITGNTAGDRGAGLHFSYSAPVVDGNAIVGNQATATSSGFGGGIYCGRPPTAETNRATLIVSNAIRANVSSASGAGIECDDRSRVLIRRNLIIQNRAGGVGGGVEIYQATATLEHNLIAGNVLNAKGDASFGLGGGGVGIYGRGAASLQNNVFIANANVGSLSEGGGIWSNQRGALICNNTLLGNLAAKGAGIHDTGGATVLNNIIAFGKTGVLLAANSVFSNNCVYANGTKDYASTNFTGRQGNISVDPELTADFARGEFHLAPDSPCRDAGNDHAVAPDAFDFDSQGRIQGAAVDIGADESDGTFTQVPARIVRVSPDGDDANDGASWAQAKRTVQGALDTAALPGGEVWVQAGTHFANLLLPYLGHLYGGFSGSETNRDERDWRNHVTILDGQNRDAVIDACDGATAYDGGTFCTIDGFVVQNGRVLDGGGISVKGSLSADVRNNLIRWNTSTNGNGGAGGIYLTGSGLSVVGNTVVSNFCPGRVGGVYLSGGFALRNNYIGVNTVSSNFIPPLPTGPASALYCAPGSVGQIVNNTFLGNGFVAGEGGGVALASSNLLVANNLIAFNSSGIKVHGNAPALSHNCVFGNTDFNYSGIADPTGLDGNLSADPLLAALGDFRLATHSPCIDAAEDAAADPDWLDLDGEPRMMGAHVDIGADEATRSDIWQRGLNAAAGIQFTTTHIGGLTYGTFEVMLPDSCYRLLSVGPLTRAGTEFSRDFRILHQTGGICLPVATVLRTNFLLGRLLAGDYTLTARAWDVPVQTNLFMIAADNGPTLISMDVLADSLAAFTTLGVPDVRYVVEASPNLAEWSGLVTNVGAPFRFADRESTNWAQRFYRVSVGP